jgi:uncharacterized membrane protein (DUF2068 family)
MPTKSRGTILTIFAIMFVFVAITDFIKPFHLFPNDGFVFLGTKLTGVANAIVAPAFGAILMLYAYGVWTMRRFALPFSYLATASVVLNMVLYTMKNGDTRALPLINVVAGIGVPLAAAIVLSLRRGDLT